MKFPAGLFFALLFGVPFPAFAGRAETTSERVTVVIPFRFIAGDMSFESGEYTFTVDDPEHPHVVGLEDGTGGDVELSTTVTKNARAEPPPRSGVVFHRYGEQDILGEVYVSGRRARYELERGAIENELIRAGRRAEEVDVPAEPQ